MKALITGISGFVGSHLAEYLFGQGVKVFGTYHPGANLDNLESVVQQLELTEYDLISGDPENLIGQVQPDLIFHLAAQSSVARSWEYKEETLQTNINGTVRLLEAVRRVGADPTILLVGSAEEYGPVRPEETPIKESQPAQPANPYGVSKLAAGLLGLQYHWAYGLKVLAVRAFNHLGPRQAPGFAAPDFARQIAEIEAGQLAPVLRVGNLTARRDFTDVRDIVRAYWLLAAKGQPGEVYNVGSGKAVPVALILDTLLQMSRVPVSVEENPDRMRPSDVPILLGNTEKIRRTTGWRPEICLEDSLHAVLNYWREKINR